jgi:transcriptional regulator with XRE-family HTH domain
LVYFGTMDNEIKAFSEGLRMARITKGLSQENIAFELGITPGAYSKIERGITDVSLSRLVDIAKVMGIPLADLVVGRTTTKPKLPPFLPNKSSLPPEPAIDFSEVNYWVRAHLIALAKRRQVTDYSELNEKLKLNMKLEFNWARQKMGVILSNICLFEHYESRPLLSVLVIDRNLEEPGSGFYRLARDIGTYNGQEDDSVARGAYFETELAQTFLYWQENSRHK